MAETRGRKTVESIFEREIHELSLAEMKRRKEVAELKLLEAKAEKETLANRKALLDIESASGNMCYIATALREFSRVLSVFVREVDGLPESLQAAASLSPHQYKIVREEVQALRRRLAACTVDLSSTKEIADESRAASAKTTAAVDKAASVKKDDE